MCLSAKVGYRGLVYNVNGCGGIKQADTCGPVFMKLLQKRDSLLDCLQPCFFFLKKIKRMSLDEICSAFNAN